MNTLDILIVGVNTLLILVIFQTISRFWEYRVKQKLIREGFIDEQSLDKIYHWNQKRERFNLIKTGIFTLCISLGLLVAYISGIATYEGLLMVIIIMFSIAVGAFLTLLVTKKF